MHTTDWNDVFLAEVFPYRSDGRMVSLVVLLHVYFGQLLLDLSRGRTRHGALFFGVLGWLPLPLFLGIAALVAAKPGVLPLP